jgi:NAD(P)-dependent dehydrogenase (short-subunit alcohol dehydrogenase family)
VTSDCKTVVVTGAARGLGLAMADRFAGDGWQVAIVDRDGETLRRVHGKLTEDGGRAVMPVEADLTDGDDARRVVEDTVRSFGGIDVLVNNAGLAPVIPFFETSMAQVREILSVNVEAVFRLTQLVARQMIAQGRGGRIITLGSANAHVGVNQTAAYTASKGAVTALTRELAVELGSYGIRCNVVAPGTVITPRVRAMLDDEGIRRRLDRIPAGRFATEQDVAAVTLFLASDEAEAIHGQVLIIDGGFSIMGA